MLCTRFVCNLGYRSCSTFSSVLTLGKKSQLSDAKSNQSAEADQDVQILPNHDLKKNNEQFRQTNFASSSNDWDRGLSRSAKYGTHAASDESRGVNNDKKYNRNNTGKWRTGVDWKGHGEFNRVDKDNWKQRSKSKWTEQGSGGSGKWDSRSTSWNKSDNDWDSDEDQWDSLSKSSKQFPGQNYRPSQTPDHHQSRWAQRPYNPQHQRHHLDQPSSPSQSSHDRHRDKPHYKPRDQSHDKPYYKPRDQPHDKPYYQSRDQSRDKPYYKPRDQPHDKPRGKRLRKKEKLGFIESEPAPAVADAEQLLYGLHPVGLALSAGRREVRRVYHRADAGPADGRLARLLAECAARGVGTVPLPAAQLDRLAAGSGVHQGVCARVTPLPPRSVDELLAQAGCPPLAAEPEEQKAAPAAGSVDADVARLEVGSGMSGTADSEFRLPVSVGSEKLPETGPVSVGFEKFPETGPVSVGSEEKSPETGPVSAGSEEQSPETGPPGRTTDPEERPEVDPPEVAAPASERRRVWLMLDQVQDPMNFGSIIRSSYFLGVDAVIIPDKNSCPLSPTVSKASAGTLEVFPVYTVPADSCRQLLQLLASRQWQLLAAGTAADGAEQAEGAISADTDTLLIVGNEGRGVTPSLASLCRSWTLPPQRHLADGVESLNVGVAAGILLSQLIRPR